MRARSIRAAMAWTVLTILMASVPAALAAVFSDSVVAVTLEDALTSYQSVAEAESYDWPLSSFIPRVLEKFDLPDVYRELQATKRFTIQSI